MVSAEKYSEIQQFNRHFKLDCERTILSFFAQNKKDDSEAVEAKVNRALHYIRTRVWINEKKICEWAAAHPQLKMSALFAGRPLERKLIRYEQQMVVPKMSYWGSLRKSLSFLKEYIQATETVGALFPSSSYLAKEISSAIPKDLHAARRRILEIGPGTGVFTDKIIKRMNPSDRLCLVEYDNKFYEQLKERYKDIPNVKVIHMSILDYKVDPCKRYDFVISGLPLNSFSVSDVRKIFLKFKDLTAEGGTLSYFDYLLLPKIKRLYLDDEDRLNFDAILRMKKDFFATYGQRIKKVLLNVFPARVLHHRLTS